MLPNICNMLQLVRWWAAMCVTTLLTKLSRESSNLACETTSYTLIRRIVVWIHLVVSIPRPAKSSRVLKGSDRLRLILELVQLGEVLMRISNLGIRFINRQSSFRMPTTSTCSIKLPRTSTTQMIESRPSKTLTWSITIVITPLDSKTHNSKSSWNLRSATNASKFTCPDKRYLVARVSRTSSKLFHQVIRITWCLRILAHTIVVL